VETDLATTKELSRDESVTGLRGAKWERLHHEDQNKLAALRQNKLETDLSPMLLLPMYKRGDVLAGGCQALVPIFGPLSFPENISTTQ